MIPTALALIFLTADGAAGDEPTRVLAGDDRASVSAAVRDLVTRAVGEAPAGYRLAVLEPGQLGADAHLQLHLAPLAAAVRQALASVRGLVLVPEAELAKRGRALLAAPDLAEVKWALNLAAAVGADGVLLLPGRQRDDEVAVTAQWIDAAQKKLLAVAPLKAQPIEVATDPSCRAAPGCAKQGKCAARAGACAAGSDADCQQAGICALGLCSARAGECVAAVDADCAHTKLCAEAGRCVAQGGRCVTRAEAEEVAAGMPAGEIRARPAASGKSAPRLDAPPAATGPREQRYNFTMMAVGVGMCGVGGVAAIVGAVVIGLGSIEGSETCTGSGASKTCRPLTDGERRAMRDIGMSILISSAVVAVAGVPVAIIGGRKVPVVQPQASAVPDVGVGPGALSLTWHF